MTNDEEKNEQQHRFEPDKEGKGIVLKMQVDDDPEKQEHTERMTELFKEVSDSKPESIADFLIRLNEINKLKL